MTYRAFPFHHHVAGDVFITMDGFHIQQTVSRFLAQGSFCLSMPDVNVRDAIVWWWWWNIWICNLHSLSIDRYCWWYPLTDLTTRTHLVCCLTSSWVQATAEFNHKDTEVQNSYWKFATNKRLWISDAAQIKETWQTGQSGWCSSPWHMATEEEVCKRHKDSFFILGCKYVIKNMTPCFFCNSFHPIREV